jgi:hypothetical protein
MSCDSNDINLEDNSLFQYVLELDGIEKDINSVGPKNPDTFGNMVEPFKGETVDKRGKKSNYMMWLSIFILISIVVLFLCSSCGNSDIPGREEMNDGLETIVNYGPFSNPVMKASFTRY